MKAASRIAARAAVTISLLAVLSLDGRGVAGGWTAAVNGLPSASIVFQRGADLYAARADGSRARVLARNAGQAAVAPDARRIAFVRNRSIWVMNRDGSGLKRLTRGREAIGPAWSPDGTMIYFSSYIVARDAQGGFAGYAWAIVRMRTNGSGVRQLTHPKPSDHGTCHDGPAPSPDGRIIAYSEIGDCDHGFDASIEAIDSSGRSVGLSQFGVDAGFDPDWSPDGRYLAFASSNGGEGIAAAAQGGSGARRIYRGGPASGPEWSPDGKWLAFSTDGHVWLVRRDGSDLRRVLDTEVWRSDPAWLPPPR